jgi:hypothetical protein
MRHHVVTTGGGDSVNLGGKLKNQDSNKPMKNFAKSSIKLTALALAAASVLGTSAFAADSASYDPASTQAAGYSNQPITKSFTLKIKAPSSLNDKGDGDLTGNAVLKPNGTVQFPANEPGIEVAINASVIPPTGVSTATALGYLAVSENTWNCLALSEEKSITVTLSIPAGAAAGDYVYTISGNPGDTGLGWGGGGHSLTASVAQYAPAENAVFVLDETAPTVNVTAPTATAFTYVTGGTPVSVAFDATELESPITSLTAKIGETPVTVSSTGLGTTSASATGSATVATIGSYTLTATAANTRALPAGNPDNLSANLSGSATVDFTVNYDMSNCWLPPLSLGKVSKGGSTVPIKFTAKDVNGLFVADNSVQVKVNEIVFDSLLGCKDQVVTTGSFGAGSGAVRIEQIDPYTGQYIVNFQTATGAHKYRVDVFFQGSKQASKEFSVSAK